jgi:hypothetical protein
MGLAKHSIEAERFSGSRVRGLLGREVGRTAKQNALAEHGLEGQEERQTEVRSRLLLGQTGYRSSLGVHILGNI